MRLLLCRGHNFAAATTIAPATAAATASVTAVTATTIAAAATAPATFCAVEAAVIAPLTQVLPGGCSRRTVAASAAVPATCRRGMRGAWLCVCKWLRLCVLTPSPCPFPFHPSLHISLDELLLLEAVSGADACGGVRHAWCDTVQGAWERNRVRRHGEITMKLECNQLCRCL